MSKLTQEVPRLGLYSGLSDSTTHVLASVPQASGYFKNIIIIIIIILKEGASSRSLGVFIV